MPSTHSAQQLEVEYDADARAYHVYSIVQAGHPIEVDTGNAKYRYPIDSHACVKWMRDESKYLWG